MQYFYSLAVFVYISATTLALEKKKSSIFQYGTSEDGKLKILSDVCAIMRTLMFAIVLFLLNFPGKAQTNIQIILKTDKQIDSVDAFDLSQKETYSFPYKDTLTFNFNKKDIDCYYIRYHEKSRMYRKQIWLNNGDLIIKAHINNDLIIDTVMNSPIYYKAIFFYSSYSDILKTNDSIKINSFLLKSYKENIDNIFSYSIGQNYLLRNQNSKLELYNFKSLLDRQGDGFKWFLLYPMVVDRVNNILSIDKLKISDFTFFDKQNKKSKLNLSGSDYYILDFWFLGCAPCRQEHKEIKLSLNKLKEKNIQVISISIDSPDKYKSWRAYLIKNKYTWRNYMEDNKSLSKYLSIGSCPKYVIVKKDGKIIESYDSFPDISKKYMLTNNLLNIFPETVLPGLIVSIQHSSNPAFVGRLTNNFLPHQTQSL